jgi:hypothetical protein
MRSFPPAVKRRGRPVAAAFARLLALPTVKSSWERAGLLAGAALLLVAAWASPRAIPYNMDEFVHYHPLGCATAELSRELPIIRDGCGYHDLALPFTTTPLPLRSYAYIGSLPSVPFYPFWRAFRDPVAVRVQGAAFFLLCGWLALRLLRVRPAALVTASLVFPVFLASFVVDEGPVALSAILLLSALLAARRALESGTGRGAVAWSALAGFALFLGLWVKLVFGWWLPAFALFALGAALRRAPTLGEAVRRWRGAIAAGLLALLAPTLVLLASVDREGRPYAAAFRWSGVSAEPEAVESVAVRLWGYVTDASLLSPRNILLPASPVDVLPALLSLGLLAFGLARGAGRRREVAGWALAGALTFALVAASGHSRWPHHFAFPLLFLVMALAVALDALGRRGRLATATLVLVFWGSLASRLPAASVPPESAREKDQLLALVRQEGLDRTTLQVHSSWGTYYIAQLFGHPRRMIVYLRAAPDDPLQLERFREVARSHGRGVLLISARRWERLHTPEVERVLGPPLRSWSFGSWWAVEYDRFLRSEEQSPRP